MARKRTLREAPRTRALRISNVEGEQWRRGYAMQRKRSRSCRSWHHEKLRYPQRASGIRQRQQRGRRKAIAEAAANYLSYLLLGVRNGRVSERRLSRRCRRKADTPNVRLGPFMPVPTANIVSQNSMESCCFASAVQLHRNPDAGTYAVFGNEFHTKRLKRYLDIAEGTLVWDPVTCLQMTDRAFRYPR